ncbi:MAG TPA: DNA cytosine methyltransferase [Acidobacteriaceae bacterium]|nr:DNA cytosine methyltransferase [Acidobacteriaceae bacterium]
MRPIGIDLFAGAGGLSLGFEQAGFDLVGAVEIDPVHCAVHKFNFPNTPVIASPIENLTADELRKSLGIGSREVDCVFGGPPCQGFSLIGHRTLDDPRNRLVSHFVNIVAGLGARTFVFENVKGLTVGAHRKFLNELVEAFDAAGYEVRLPWRVLDAAQFGVPQHRERLFLLGVRKGLAVPDYPSQQTNPADRPTLLNDLAVGPTCKDAVADLPNADAFPSLLKGDSVAADFGDSSEYALSLRCIGNAGWYFGYERRWNKQMLTSSARTIHTSISQRRFRETKPGCVEPISRFLKLSPDGLCNTLRAGTDGARGAFTSPRPIHYAYARCITVREMARLHGFPDWFRFHSTKWHGARQIGNSVPPPLGRAVAAEIIRALGVRPERATDVLDLGNPLLLSMEMSEAAEHFGVIAPKSRRDRKSGAKKRKQQEIELVRLRLKKRA